MNQSRQVTHPNVIIHVDIDYFYAQVEEVLNPELRDKPFGIQQGLNVVTCNYIARSFGIKKWRSLKECLEKCPELVLVNGEDLSNYKIYSKRISELLHALIGPSERMGLDEHYLDITKLVNEKLAKMSDDDRANVHISGPFYPNEEAFSECKCGCDQRLIVGSQIAREIRDKMLEDLKLTCSVGVAHNKLLAKLVGQLNKPNNQTTLAPTAAALFMASLKDVRSIFGVGGKTAIRIEELGVTTIEQLQNCSIEKLQKSFLSETAIRLKEMSMGRDSSTVKPSEKSKTVGLEDSFNLLSRREDVEEKFRDLLPHLVLRIQDDVRIPQSLRVTVRKYDVVKKLSTRESKQFALLPSSFKFVNDIIQLSDGSDVNILRNVMILFDRMVDKKQKYFINLVGLCFTKFQEQKRGVGSIFSFLKKQEQKIEIDSTESKQLAHIEIEPSFKSTHELEPSPKRIKTFENRLNEAPPPSLEIPSNIDPTVWHELPLDVQRDLMRSWQTPSSSNSKQLQNQVLCHGSKKNRNVLYDLLTKK